MKPLKKTPSKNQNMRLLLHCDLTAPELLFHIQVHNIHNIPNAIFDLIDFFILTDGEVGVKFQLLQQRQSPQALETSRILVGSASL
jgi:hypothetical protein